ncbi:MAG: flagellar biosynthesis protein FlhF [Firmicutes bacterium]|nr:flagellar biosynthesis protein FlhF [Alicyclobacillaceae bacterium]MCL6497309.1 flagellar biosynthesis protein FlhF [Bacillota bacterium]
MIVKRYSGRTAEEALNLAKFELGEDAVILSSGRTRDRWWKFWENGFQVLVATDSPPHAQNGRREGHEAGAAVPPPPPPTPAAGESGEGRNGPFGFERRMEALLERLEQRIGRMEGFSGSHQESAFRFLRERGMEEAWARSLARALSEDEAGEWRAAIVERVVAELPEVLPLTAKGARAVMLVGPTGSGKTTTLAKLAAHLCLEEKVPVTLVTTDTFRVGAVEQLETFSDILGVPFRVAKKPKELAQLVEAQGEGLVLIDTPGHSVRHPLYMAELRALQQTARPEVFLTVPAVLAPAEIRALKAGFLPEGRGRVVLTKADESHTPGAVLGALIDLGLPLSYVTHGQGVPEDIEVVRPERLKSWLLAGEYHA